MNPVSLRTKYLEFVETGTSPSGRTKRWEVRSISQDASLGGIEWFGRWRQYVFAPGPETVFNNQQGVHALRRGVAQGPARPGPPLGCEDIGDVPF